MPQEILDVVELQIGSRRDLRYGVYFYPALDFTISEATWELLERDTGRVVLSGLCNVNNDDRDDAGNVAKTVEAPVLMTQDDVATLEVDGVWRTIYWLLIHYVLSTGEDDWIKVPVRVIDVRRPQDLLSPSVTWTTTTTTTTTVSTSTTTTVSTSTTTTTTTTSTTSSTESSTTTAAP